MPCNICSSSLLPEKARGWEFLNRVVNEYLNYWPEIALACSHLSLTEQSHLTITLAIHHHRNKKTKQHDLDCRTPHPHNHREVKSIHCNKTAQGYTALTEITQAFRASKEKKWRVQGKLHWVFSGTLPEFCWFFIWYKLSPRLVPPRSRTWIYYSTAETPLQIFQRLTGLSWKDKNQPCYSQNINALYYPKCAIFIIVSSLQSPASQ